MKGHYKALFCLKELNKTSKKELTLSFAYCYDLPVWNYIIIEADQILIHHFFILLNEPLFMSKCSNSGHSW
jgi:hypothetical protein